MSRKLNKTPLKIILTACLLIFSIIGLSSLSVQLWSSDHQEVNKPAKLLITAKMTVGHFSDINGISKPILKKILGLKTKQDFQKRLDSFGISQKQLVKKMEQAQALQEEDSSKNWLKIPLKFGLWITVLGTAFFLFKQGKITPVTRKILYLSAVIIFGVILGADPSPMGPIKDALALYGAKGIIFKPRVVALCIFLATVILANKSICAWGCQFGTLQDLLFRINRNQKDTRGIIRQYKPPFMVTNTIRILFFSVFTAVAFFWATDLIELIDPFKLFKPAMVSSLGWIFLTFLAITSLFIYRPWCHLFCPFGLIGWLAEHISLFKIKVNHQTCTNCGACIRACPSNVMEAIMENNTIKPDCFTCGTCINVCPTKSISLKR